MDVAPLLLILHSEDPNRLVAFYKDMVQLTPRFDVVPGGFAMGEDPAVSLIVEGHSDVRGATKDPRRMMLNFSVADVTAEASRLQGLGVPFVREPYEEPGVGMFATFTDPDGNYCQLVHLYE